MNWGIVGTGAMAARFAVAARAAGSRAVAVCSRRTGSGGDFARRFGIAQVVPSVTALAALPDVAAIYIATPNDRHAADAKAALGAGKPVLCEKPLAVSAAQAREVVEAARAARLFCMEGLWSLTLPNWRAAFAAVAEGKIGALREIHGDFSVPQSPTAMPRLFAPGGGGALLDRGVYLIALARAAMGDAALAHASGELDRNGVDLAATLVLRGAAGARAVLTCAIDRMGENRFTLLGDRGRIVLEEPVTNPSGWQLTSADPQAAFSGPAGFPGLVDRLKAAAVGRPRLSHLAKAVLRAPKGGAGGLQDQIAHVEACLAAGRMESDLVPLDHSVAVLALIDQARAALGQSGSSSAA